MMKSIQLSTLFVAIIMLLGCANNSDSNGSDDDQDLSFDPNNGGITLPQGFQAVVVAEDVGSARHVAVNENGDIYLALDEETSGGGIAALRDTNGNGEADEIEYFGDHTGTGLEIYNGYLYSSSDEEVFRYDLSEDSLIPQEEPELLITGFPDQNSHTAKPFTLDDNGNIYVTVGSPSNTCEEEDRTEGAEGQNPCPELERQAGIWQFNSEESDQTQQEDGHRYATGIRNAVALDWNDTVGFLYAVQHGRDQLDMWPDFDEQDNAELPAEEFLQVEDGDNFGWPYTYYDHHQEQRVLAPEYGGDGEETADTAEYKDPIYSYPAHWAPNDLLFYTEDQFPNEYKNGAFIAFHGSWNRAPEQQEGYRVTFQPFDGDTPSGDHETFANDFAGTDDIGSPGDAQYRPMGLATGPDGSLYISDSVEGKIWRIVYTDN